ncbi:MAG: glutamine-hydrolyzing carbamoyl-phosphate synthase small subunit [Acidilobaceae archaeon]|nr:glutamine-hydrolyzing carbamoyl-phosphate synthase small subunit [Acidilobaceae archaeon]
MGGEGFVIHKIKGLRCERKARLLLANGTAIEGCSFGYPGTRVGEIVFSTSMTGYTEALTDPSYAGQILVWTHPMVGCYGVPSREHAFCGVPINYESNMVAVEGFVVSELPPHNHYLSVSSLSEWLENSGVPGIYGVDTRAIVKTLREAGVMMAAISAEEADWEDLRRLLSSSPSYDSLDFTELVSPKATIVHRPENPLARVSLLDCGLKYGILRNLLRAGLEVHRLPCSSKADELLEGYDGVVLSNGPGNPALLKEKVRVVENVLLSGKPVLGICLGMQLSALALGARTFKLRYGHRGPNKGVIDLMDKKSYITTQNHGYAVDEASLEGTGLYVWFRNADDGTIEGLLHRELKAFLVQFHPEGGPGPWDTAWIFHKFAKVVRDGKSS